jgi:hypothetical protein
VDNFRFSIEANKASPPQGSHWLTIPIDKIGVVAQMRGTMNQDRLEDLAKSIEEKGQLHPAIVVALSEEEAEIYLLSINQMWGKEYSLSAFPYVYVEEYRRRYYFFLVAGHRRLEAVKKIKGRKLVALTHFGVPYSKAVALQYHENNHEQVRSDEEARFLTLLWRQKLTEDPRYPLVRFAKELGKTSDFLRSAIRFTSLPLHVQKLVVPSKDFKKGVAYGILCELSRLNEAKIKIQGLGYNEKDLILLAYSFITEQKTVKMVKETVSQRIRGLEGQEELFELSMQEVADGAKHQVTSGVEKSVRLAKDHLARVARFHEEEEGVQHIPRIVSPGCVQATINALTIAATQVPAIIEGLRGARSLHQAKKSMVQAITP